MKKQKLLLLACCMLASVQLLAQKHIDKAFFVQNIWNYEKDRDAIRLKTDVPVIIDFYADWCRPCKMLAPELTALQKEYQGKLLIYKVNVDEDRDLAVLFQASMLPTLYFIPKSGKPAYVQGYRTKDELKQIVDSYLLK